MKTKTIALIGAGNMGHCLLGGLLAKGYDPDHLWACDPSKERLTYVQQHYQAPFHTTTDNSQALKKADVVILAVKPQIIPAVMQEIAAILDQTKPLIISIAAGISVGIIQHFLKSNAAIVRSMPNTPAMIATGATALYANANVTHELRDLAESIFRAVGIVVWLSDEKQMDAVTAVSGSGPAYFFLMMEAIENAGKSLGLSPEVARLLTLQTAYGAARMALESEHSTAELRKQVTSPGGTTEKALGVFEEAKLRQICESALKAASIRSDELTQLISKEMEL